MYLEIDGKSYFIYLKANTEAIIIKSIENEIVHLYVPARYPQENLITYIRKELPKQIKKATKQSSKLEFLTIFDKKFSISLKNTEIPYIKNEILFINSKGLTTASKVIETKNQLLKNHINSLLSAVEEDLNITLPIVNLKKLKTNYYSNCHTKQSITFSKLLVEKPRDFINYVVLHAVGEFLNISDKQVLTMFDKYISDLKHWDRVYKYEQQHI